MLNLHRDKKLQGVNRGDMGRSFVTTGRMVIMRSIGYKCDKGKKKKKKVFRFSAARGSISGMLCRQSSPPRERLSGRHARRTPEILSGIHELSISF